MAIFEFSDQLVDKLTAADPLLATEVGVAGYDDRWPDLSPEGVAAWQQLWAETLAEVETMVADSKRDQLAKRVITEEAKAQLASYECGDHYYDLNNTASPTQALRDVFDMQPADSAADWEAIITRLETIAEPLDGYRETLEQGCQSGHAVARRQVEAVIVQCQFVASDESGFELLRQRLSDAGHADQWELSERLDVAIATAKAAYESFNSYLIDSYFDFACSQDSVGPKRYGQAVKRWLGAEIDLAATYRWGWGEVERLSARVNEICEQIAPTTPVAEVLDQLNSDLANDAGSAEAFIQIMAERQKMALEALDGTYFDVPDQIREIEVKMAPPGGPAGAYYVPPSEDFSRPGSVWYSLVERESFPLHGEICAAYHEGFPGHHLQVGSQMMLVDELSRFHRLMVWYPGSGEGWALYASHLMGELGYFERPEYELGLVLEQLVRACCVTIDIGMHCGFTIPEDVLFYPGQDWTFDLAVELMAQRTGESEGVLASEVTRCLGWPGQAIAYKVGEKAILDMRAELSTRPNFDMKAFHSKFLSIGSLGLDLTRELMLGD